MISIAEKLLEDLREKVEKSKGFCMCRFAELLKHAETELPEKYKEWFYTTVMELMKQNLNRVKEDLDHFVEMFDYRSAGSDWRNSKDAVERAMKSLVKFSFHLPSAERKW